MSTPQTSPEGFVTPCPYIPPGPDSSNLKDKGLKEIIEQDISFRLLKNPRYNGRCGLCEFREACGGCRARALASTKDLMGEDPWCGHTTGKESAAGEKGQEPVWRKDAKARLDNVPAFLREMVRRGVERYAARRNR